MTSLWPYGIFALLAGILAFIDIKRQILPDELNYTLLWSGLLVHVFGYLPGQLEAAIIGAVAGYLCLFTVAWLFLQMKGKMGLGLGDAKLFAALGAWFGWQALPNILLIASLTGIIYALVTRQYHQRIPFGPCLILGALVSALWNH